MKNTIIFVLGCSVAAVMPSRARAEDTVCIHVYNLAQVRPGALNSATGLARRMFAKAGIRTTWDEHSADSSESNLVDLNTSVLELSRSENRSCLVVRLVRDLPSTAYPGALGFAHPLARFGVNAEILYRRVEFQAASVGMDPYILLAQTMAHEIGHVLLRSSEHSPVGIMQAHPGAEIWRLTSMGLMSFLPEEAKQMRQEVRRLDMQTRKPITVASNEVAGLKD